MTKIIGIRREDKNIWERRVPLIPPHVRELKEKHSVRTLVQPFERRAFSDSEYSSFGAELIEDLSGSEVIFAVKEIPVKLLMPGKVYVFFSHTIKGQSYNMPLLRKLMELKCTLIDYECIADDKGRRIVFFGKYAGLAGMIDTFHGIGKRYKYLGFDNPFVDIKPAYEYKDVNEAKNHISEIGARIKTAGLPEGMNPFVVAFAGYGNVSKGAQEIFDLIPFKELQPDELLSMVKKDKHSVYKTVFYEKDMVEPIDRAQKFDLQLYYKKPELFKSKFERYIPHFDVLINAIYWDEKYPRLIRKNYLNMNGNSIKLQVVGDISCDINGAVEFTEKVTQSDNPAYVYNPNNNQIIDGYEGDGIVNIAVDNLPTEIPVDSSISFSESLLPYIPSIAEADYNASFEELGLPAEIKRAVILHNGELTEKYKYLKSHLGE